ncbi:MAG: hypothetical protein EOP68_20710 [Sphingomonas sp.]|nr:MAG: hypothetical protein EOP68_20710 [Sphingomonas sp.]
MAAPEAAMPASGIEAASVTAPATDEAAPAADEATAADPASETTDENGTPRRGWWQRTFGN